MESSYAEDADLSRNGDSQFDYAQAGDVDSSDDEFGSERGALPEMTSQEEQELAANLPEADRNLIRAPPPPPPESQRRRSRRQRGQGTEVQSVSNPSLRNLRRIARSRAGTAVRDDASTTAERPGGGSTVVIERPGNYQAALENPGLRATIKAQKQEIQRLQKEMRDLSQRTASITANLRRQLQEASGDTETEQKLATAMQSLKVAKAANAALRSDQQKIEAALNESMDRANKADEEVIRKNEEIDRLTRQLAKGDADNGAALERARQEIKRLEEEQNRERTEARNIVRNRDSAINKLRNQLAQRDAQPQAVGVANLRDLRPLRGEELYNAFENLTNDIGFFPAIAAAAADGGVVIRLWEAVKKKQSREQQAVFAKQILRYLRTGAAALSKAWAFGRHLPVKGRVQTGAAWDLDTAVGDGDVAAANAMRQAEVKEDNARAAANKPRLTRELPQYLLDFADVLGSNSRVGSRVVTRMTENSYRNALAQLRAYPRGVQGFHSLATFFAPAYHLGIVSLGDNLIVVPGWENVDVRWLFGPTSPHLSQISIYIQAQRAVLRTTRKASWSNSRTTQQQNTMIHQALRAIVRGGGPHPFKGEEEEDGGGASDEEVQGY